MKRLLTALFITIFLIQSAESQSVKDLMQYNKTELSGSARFTAMSGAFGALGGDLSAIAQNPAASAVFLNSEIGLTLSFDDVANETSYYNTTTKGTGTDFNVGQFGLVLVQDNTDTYSDWSRISFGLNIDKIANFENNYNVLGTAPNGIDNYFLYFADGLPFKNLRLYENETIPEVYRILGEDFGYGAQQAFLGYQSYLIDPLVDDDETTGYISNASYDNVGQDYLFNSQGFHRKFTFNMGALYRDFLYLGMNLNLFRVIYSQRDNLIENNYLENSFIQEVEFENRLDVLGDGVSIQLGAIAKVGDGLRLGLSYESPEWLVLQEETSQYLSVIRQGDNGLLEETLDPQVVNLYSDTQIKIPSKFTGSFAYVFKKLGLISFDYTYSNYGNVSFITTDSNYLQSINRQANNELQAAAIYRFGAELLLGKLSLRGGAFSEESRRKDGLDSREGMSFGLGYDFGSSALNLSVVSQNTNNPESLYAYGLTDSYQLNQDKFRVFLSYNFKL